MKRPRLSGLRVHLLVLILFAILPPVALVVYADVEQRQAALAEAGDQLKRVVRLLALEERRAGENAASMLGALAEAPAVQGPNGEACESVLRGLLPRNPQYAVLGATDRAGTIVCSVPRIETSVNLADRGFFRRALESPGFAGGEYEGAGLISRPTMVYSSPILEPDGVRGIVFVGLDLTWLGETAIAADLPTGGVLVALDGRGSVLTAYPEAHSALGGPFPGAAEVRARVQEHSPTVLELPALDGAPTVFAFTQLGRQGERAFVGLGIPTETILHDANRTLARNLLILGLVSLLLFETAWIGGDLLVLRRVKPLLAATRRLAAGDLSARTGLAPAPGELGELTSAFDEMAESLARAEEQKRTEEALRRRNYELEQQNLAIQSADQLKDEFVSMVSHELRTPLTSINGYVDLLLDGDVGRVTEDQRECLVAIRENGRRLLALITDLLEISRIEAGRVDLQRTVVDIRPVIDSVAASFRPQVQAKGQQIVAEVADGVPLVFADPDRVAQILTNLISNAHKYTPRGGAITLRAALEDGRVRVSVEDTGVGLQPNELSQIFAKFYRAQNEATRGVTGTGLGLSITRSLVEAHQGEIAVTSAPGQGSTFSFTLPTQAPD